eukprot:scaffold1803_cov92-Amphora_coffeaeformis.AAC.85
MASVSTRANYISRLRRAFLLRVHPDLFRNHSDTIRHEQSKLVKLLFERMSESDFTAWQSYKAPRATSLRKNMNNTKPESKQRGTLTYAIQRRDGTLLRHRLPLHQSVENLLRSMAEALKQSGAGASVPPFPKDGPHKSSQFMESMRNGAGQSTVESQVDESYNVYSNRGRSLRHFLDQLDPQEIAQRKASRLDAQAIASQVRRLYQFQAVDATSLGWSSASAAVLFQRLLALHAEHGHKLRVDSFHPLRLVFSNDDSIATVDHYGGILYISPSSTPLQWLSHLKLVTPEVLEEIRFRRNHVAQMQKELQSYWGLKWKKGYSCESIDFYNFLVCLTQSLPTETPDRESHALVTEQLVITVESPLVCRRPVTSRDGAIQLGADMDESQVRSAISRLRPVAAEKVADSQAERNRCSDLAQQATWLLGLSRLDYRATGLLQPTDVRLSLSRLVQESDRFKHGLAGQHVGIVASGQFCHLGDDGSVKIPHDWH